MPKPRPKRVDRLTLDAQQHGDRFQLMVLDMGMPVAKLNWRQMQSLRDWLNRVEDWYGEPGP